MGGSGSGFFLKLIDLRPFFDIFCATALGVLVFGRVTEARTLWLLRGYLFLVALAWFVQRYANLPLTSKLVDALVLGFGVVMALKSRRQVHR